MTFEWIILKFNMRNSMSYRMWPNYAFTKWPTYSFVHNYSSLLISLAQVIGYEDLWFPRLAKRFPPDQVATTTL